MADVSRGDRIEVSGIGDCEVVRTVATGPDTVNVELSCGKKISAAPHAHDNLHASPLANGQGRDRDELEVKNAGERTAEEEGLVTPTAADAKDEPDSGPVFGEAERR